MTENVQTVETVETVSSDVKEDTLLGSSETTTEVEGETSEEVVQEDQTNDETVSKETQEEIDYKLDIEEVDVELFNEVLPLFKELKISNDGANKLAKFYADKLQQDAENFNTLVNNWKDQAAKDPEIGGDKFEASLSQAKLALDKVGTDALKAALSESGMGNHPELIKAFARMGAMMKDDTVVKGEAVQHKAGLLDRLYKD